MSIDEAQFSDLANESKISTKSSSKSKSSKKKQKSLSFVEEKTNEESNPEDILNLSNISKTKSSKTNSKMSSELNISIHDNESKSSKVLQSRNISNFNEKSNKDFNEEDEYEYNEILDEDEEEEQNLFYEEDEEEEEINESHISYTTTNSSSAEEPFEFTPKSNVKGQRIFEIDSIPSSSSHRIKNIIIASSSTASTETESQEEAHLEVSPNNLQFEILNNSEYNMSSANQASTVKKKIKKVVKPKSRAKIINQQVDIIKNKKETDTDESSSQSQTFNLVVDSSNIVFDFPQIEEEEENEENHKMKNKKGKSTQITMKKYIKRRIPKDGEEPSPHFTIVKRNRKESPKRNTSSQTEIKKKPEGFVTKTKKIRVRRKKNPNVEIKNSNDDDSNANNNKNMLMKDPSSSGLFDDIDSVEMANVKVPFLKTNEKQFDSSFQPDENNKCGNLKERKVSSPYDFEQLVDSIKLPEKPITQREIVDKDTLLIDKLPISESSIVESVSSEIAYQENNEQNSNNEKISKEEKQKVIHNINIHDNDDEYYYDSSSQNSENENIDLSPEVEKESDFSSSDFSQKNMKQSQIIKNINTTSSYSDVSTSSEFYKDYKKTKHPINQQSTPRKIPSIDSSSSEIISSEAPQPKRRPPHTKPTKDPSTSSFSKEMENVNEPKFQREQQKNSDSSILFYSSSSIKSSSKLSNKLAPVYQKEELSEEYSDHNINVDDVSEEIPNQQQQNESSPIQSYIQNIPSSSSSSQKHQRQVKNNKIILTPTKMKRVEYSDSSYYSSNEIHFDQETQKPKPKANSDDSPQFTSLKPKQENIQPENINEDKSESSQFSNDFENISHSKYSNKLKANNENSYISEIKNEKRETKDNIDEYEAEEEETKEVSSMIYELEPILEKTKDSSSDDEVTTTEDLSSFVFGQRSPNQDNLQQEQAILSLPTIEEMKTQTQTRSVTINTNQLQKESDDEPSTITEDPSNGIIGLSPRNPYRKKPAELEKDQEKLKNEVLMKHQNQIGHQANKESQVQKEIEFKDHQQSKDESSSSSISDSSSVFIGISPQRPINSKKSYSTTDSQSISERKVEINSQNEEKTIENQSSTFSDAINNQSYTKANDDEKYEYVFEEEEENINVNEIFPNHQFDEILGKKNDKTQYSSSASKYGSPESTSSSKKSLTFEELIAQIETKPKKVDETQKIEEDVNYKVEIPESEKYEYEYEYEEDTNINTINSNKLNKTYQTDLKSPSASPSGKSSPIKLFDMVNYDNEEEEEDMNEYNDNENSLNFSGEYKTSKKDKYQIDRIAKSKKESNSLIDSASGSTFHSKISTHSIKKVIIDSEEGSLTSEENSLSYFSDEFDKANEIPPNSNIDKNKSINDESSVISTFSDGNSEFDGSLVEIKMPTFIQTKINKKNSAKSESSLFLSSSEDFIEPEDNKKLEKTPKKYDNKLKNLEKNKIDDAKSSKSKKVDKIDPVEYKSKAFARIKERFSPQVKSNQQNQTSKTVETQDRTQYQNQTPIKNPINKMSAFKKESNKSIVTNRKVEKLNDSLDEYSSSEENSTEVVLKLEDENPSYHSIKNNKRKNLKQSHEHSDSSESKSDSDTYEALKPANLISQPTNKFIETSNRQSISSNTDSTQNPKTITNELSVKENEYFKQDQVNIESDSSSIDFSSAFLNPRMKNPDNVPKSIPHKINGDSDSYIDSEDEHEDNENESNENTQIKDTKDGDKKQSFNTQSDQYSESSQFSNAYEKQKNKNKKVIIEPTVRTWSTTSSKLSGESESSIHAKNPIIKTSTSDESESLAFSDTYQKINTNKFSSSNPIKKNINPRGEKHSSPANTSYLNPKSNMNKYETLPKNTISNQKDTILGNTNNKHKNTLKNSPEETYNYPVKEKLNDSIHASQIKTEIESDFSSTYHQNIGKSIKIDQTTKQFIESSSFSEKSSHKSENHAENKEKESSFSESNSSAFSAKYEQIQKSSPKAKKNIQPTKEENQFSEEEETKKDSIENQSSISVDYSLMDSSFTKKYEKIKNAMISKMNETEQKLNKNTSSSDFSVASKNQTNEEDNQKEQDTEYSSKFSDIYQKQGTPKQQDNKKFSSSSPETSKFSTSSQNQSDDDNDDEKEEEEENSDSTTHFSVEYRNAQRTEFDSIKNIQNTQELFSSNLDSQTEKEEDLHSYEIENSKSEPYTTSTFSDEYQNTRNNPNEAIKSPSKQSENQNNEMKNSSETLDSYSSNLKIDEEEEKYENESEEAGNKTNRKSRISSSSVFSEEIKKISRRNIKLGENPKETNQNNSISHDNGDYSYVNQEEEEEIVENENRSYSKTPSTSGFSAEIQKISKRNINSLSCISDSSSSKTSKLSSNSNTSSKKKLFIPVSSSSSQFSSSLISDDDSNEFPLSNKKRNQAENNNQKLDKNEKLESYSVDSSNFSEIYNKKQSETTKVKQPIKKYELNLSYLSNDGEDLPDIPSEGMNELPDISSEDSIETLNQSKTKTQNKKIKKDETSMKEKPTNLLKSNSHSDSDSPSSSKRKKVKKTVKFDESNNQKQRKQRDPNLSSSFSFSLQNIPQPPEEGSSLHENEDFGEVINEQVLNESVKTEKFKIQNIQQDNLKSKSESSSSISEANEKEKPIKKSKSDKRKERDNKKSSDSHSATSSSDFAYTPRSNEKVTPNQLARTIEDDSFNSIPESSKIGSPPHRSLINDSKVPNKKENETYSDAVSDSSSMSEIFKSEELSAIPLAHKDDLKFNSSSSGKVPIKLEELEDDDFGIDIEGIQNNGSENRKMTKGKKTKVEEEKITLNNSTSGSKNLKSSQVFEFDAENEKKKFKKDKKKDAKSENKVKKLEKSEKEIETKKKHPIEKVRKAPNKQISNQDEEEAQAITKVLNLPDSPVSSHSDKEDSSLNLNSSDIKIDVDKLFGKVKKFKEVNGKEVEGLIEVESSDVLY
ncbi:hypothetical protein TRFO_22444 [Tritrichomonas foetus]|uniref:Uncharacterized protein n=1 Tax=Tritrichomonas foetus TaxID=1144522 RepID=A0A1J4KD14_9EUKA|nr:hypothetical protein TRFO_22444 [Tritrichomonas foetus]|eukprot:OHT08866.1 hypothetical protein TRFO_22444 [Tritrichomonas foetus]